MSNLSVWFNARRLTIYPFDDRNTLLLRYALLNNDALPEYYIIVDSDFVVTNQKHYIVEDIRDELTDDLPSRDEILSLTDKYPMKFDDVLALWLQRDIEITEQLSRDIFELSKYFSNAERRKEEYKISVTVRREGLQRESASILARMKQLSTTQWVDDAEPSPLDIKRYSVVLRFVVLDADVEDVFDAMKVSSIIPIIGLKTAYKVFENTEIKSAWIDYFTETTPSREKKMTLPSGINMKVNEEGNVFSDANWSDRHMLSIDVSTSIDRESTKSSILQSIDSSLKYTLVPNSEHVTHLKIVFGVKESKFNAAIFYDLFVNHPIVKQFFFIKEGDDKSSMEKEQMYIYYKSILTSELRIQVMIHRANVMFTSTIPDRQTGEVLRQILGRIMVLYRQQYPIIKKIYKSVIPDFDERSPDGYTKPSGKIGKRTKSKVEKAGDEHKTQAKLKKLREHGPPGLFSEDVNYARAVSAKTQPTIVPDDKIQEYLHASGGITKLAKQGKIMRYPLYGEDARWYVCGTFPGLKENTERLSLLYPYFPQCMKKSYHDGTSTYKIYIGSIKKRQPKNEDALLKKYIDTLLDKGFQFDVSYESGQKDMAYVLRPDNVAGDRRFGHLPRNLQEMALRSGVTESRLQRLGVPVGPDSFLYCVAMTQEEFRKLTPEERQEELNRIRKELAESLEAGKQELVHVNAPTILRRSDYVDPTLFVSLVAEYYQVNIFLYKWSITSFHGEFVIPAHSKVYLQPELVSDKEVVMVIIYESINDIPQCNLIVYRTTDNVADTIYSFSTDHFIVREAEKMRKESYKVWMTTVEEDEERKVVLHRYTPSSRELVQGVESQYIDDHGKTRMLNYSMGVSLMTPPLPPIGYTRSVSISTTLRESTTIADAINFVEQKGMEIVSQDVVNDSIVGLWTTQGYSLGAGSPTVNYIPLTPSTQLKDVEVTSRINPLRTQASSLAIWRRNRDIVDLLKKYALYAYSLGTYHAVNSYNIVDLKWHYDIENISRSIDGNKTFYDDGKIIVPSDNIRIRLHSYLLIQLLNDRPRVESLKDKVLLWDHYTKIDDFTSHRNEIVLLGIEQLHMWFNANRDENIVHINIQPLLKRPYFYKNYKLGNSIMMIQNVEEGNIRRALAVSKRWNEDRVNLGYNVGGTDIAELDDPEDYQYVIYTIDGLLASTKLRRSEIIVMRYDRNTFAAVLKMN